MTPLSKAEAIDALRLVRELLKDPAYRLHIFVNYHDSGRYVSHDASIHDIKGYGVVLSWVIGGMDNFGILRLDDIKDKDFSLSKNKDSMVFTYRDRLHHLKLYKVPPPATIPFSS